jgi:replicative DNA helicase Mcm
VTKELPDKTQLRGNVHMAIIGDPSTAKSQLLRKVIKISPRGIFTSGKTASAAGLTAAAVKDGNTWTLEGGAAVMASGGILAIDEIGQAKQEDLSALHELMEQQTISISKAGIVSTIRAECAVLAAGNPETGYFKQGEPIPDQIKLPKALWTRFDLIFVYCDVPEPEKDQNIARHILRNHNLGEMIQNKSKSKSPVVNDADLKKAKKEIEAPIPADTLWKYIAFARSCVFPVMDSESMKQVESFYLNIRSMKGLDRSNPVPISARNIEALIRLSEARARMRLSNTVTVEDAKFAIKIVSESLKNVGFDPETGKMDASLIEFGQSQSQAEKMNWLQEILKNKVTESEIITLMKSRHNVDEEKTKHILKKSYEKGTISLNCLDGIVKLVY